MKANELMVGDFVTRQNYENKAVVCKIIELSKNSISVEFDNGSRSMGASEDSINPIPLTPEILEKNGFYHKTNVGYIDDDYNGRQIIYDFWNHNLKIIYNYKTMLDIEGWLDHIHVHELQHALKLCGIEKTIEL